MDNEQFKTEYVSARRAWLEHRFSGLNPMQRQAVLATEGPVLILAGAIGLMFIGNIEYTFTGDSLTVKTAFFSDAAIDCEDILSVTYREEGVPGTRTYGFGSARLLLGHFHNDELGDYLRYTYTGNHPAIIIDTGDQKVVIGTDNAADTLALYEQIDNCIMDD